MEYFIYRSDQLSCPGGWLVGQAKCLRMLVNWMCGWMAGLPAVGSVLGPLALSRLECHSNLVTLFNALNTETFYELKTKLSLGLHE